MLVGIFAISDLAISVVDAPDPVTAGNNLTYTITATNAGPDLANAASWSDTLPAGTSFVGLSAVAGWSCTTPAVGAAGAVDCVNPGFATGSDLFTLTVAVAPSVAAATVLSNSATITSSNGDPNSADNSATATTTVGTSADLAITNAASAGSVINGQPISYTIDVTNVGPSAAANVSLSNVIPANTTYTSLSAPAGWSCSTPAVGATGSVTCTIPSLGPGTAQFVITVTVDAAAPPTMIVDTASVSSTTADPNPGNEAATATTSTPVMLQSFEVD